VGAAQRFALRSTASFARRVTGLSRPTPGCVAVDGALRLAGSGRAPRVRGSQYVSLVFGRGLREAGIVQSMGLKGDCYDNAICESSHATVEKELLRRRPFPTRREARTAIFDWIEAWYG
jgi:transposase InsO family protein